MSYRVFISYRRDDQDVLAEWLGAKLATELDRGEIFLDRGALKAGDVFLAEIDQAIDSAVVFVVLIGSNWNPELSSGGHRLDNPDDVVRHELARWFRSAAGDPKRRLLPVLCGGARMPPSSELPEEIRRLAATHAFTLPNSNYSDAVTTLVGAVVAYLTNVDPAPAEDAWIIEQIARELQALGEVRLQQLRKDVDRHFQEAASAPETARGLAQAIYRIGPPAIEFLAALRQSDEQIEVLLELLATNWIRPETAGELRSNFKDALIGKVVALECVYPDFTPVESLLKASHWPKGWVPTLKVKASEPAEEIIRQIQEELAHKLEKVLKVRTTSAPAAPPQSEDERLKEERREICRQLQRRSIDKRKLPFILHADHVMALDPDLLREIEDAFPPLHILVATANADELRSASRLESVIAPSADHDRELEAFEEYATAHELISGGRRKPA